MFFYYLCFIMQKYHLGIIPDGNRRWAVSRNLPPRKGHEMGAEKMEMFLHWAVDKADVSEVSIYALSEENFKRTQEELNWLYGIYYNKLSKLLEDNTIHEKQIKVNLVSTKDEKIPENLKDVFKELVSETKFYGNKVLNVLVGYTGQSEILRAVSSPINRVKNLFFGLSEKDLQRRLAVKTDCDFVIRTGEEEQKREGKSGFLLWQSAYSEYYHINKYFPDIEKKDLDSAWNYFQECRRRKGV